MKDYKNEKLQEYLEKHISKMAIKDKFKPYIVDILLRRAYQYNLKPEEIRTDVSRLQKTLKKIEIVDRSKLGVSWAAAEYAPYEQTIRISKQTINQRSSSMIYQTLTHEVYHALSHDIYKDESTGKYIPIDHLGGKNFYTNQENYTLLETIVEKASYKTVFNSKTDNAFYNNNSSRGYKSITFVLDAIEAVYGVNEQALLRNGIQSRMQMAKFLGNMIGEDPKDTMIFLDQVEMNLAKIHRAQYPPKGEVLSNEEKTDMISDGLSDMKNVCMTRMNKRILNSKHLDMKGLETIAFDYNKINAIFEERTEFFDKVMGANGRLSRDADNNVFLKNSSSSAYIRIKDLYQVISNFDKIPQEVQGRVFNFAKNGTLISYDELGEFFAKDNPKALIPLSEFGITPTQKGSEKNRIDLISEFNTSIDRYHEIAKKRNDFDQFTEEWDNSAIKNIKNDFKPKINERIKSIFNKIKNSFKLQKSNNYQLPEAQEFVSYENNAFDERYRADKETVDKVIAVGEEFSKKENDKDFDKKSITNDFER